MRMQSEMFILSGYIIVCISPISQFYKEMAEVSKDKWDERGESHWSYWRLANEFEIDLWKQGKREVPDITKI